MDFINNLDIKLIIFVHQTFLVKPQFFWNWVSQKYLWFLFGLLVLFKLKNEKKITILLVIFVFGICILLTDRIASGIFKPFFQRLRPCHQEEIKIYLKLFEQNCGGQYGFISSHSANIWGWVTLYFKLFFTKKLEITFLILMSILISISRLMLGVHFFSDLLVGAFLGSLIGFFVGTQTKKRWLLLNG